MTVTIPPELEPFVMAKLDGRVLKSPDEVVAAALSAWEGEERLAEFASSSVEEALLAAIDSPRFEYSEARLQVIVDELKVKYRDK